MWSRREFVGAALAGAARARRPNFLVILADDMGYSDAGCYGGEIETPNLDRLAAGGLRFTQGYSTARCGPSRSGLLTGYYAQQTASDVMTPGLVPDWTRFLPEHLKPLGYRSYHSGKWHIRFKPVAAAGFDRSYCLMDQDRFFSPTRHLLNDQRLPPVQRSEGYYATNAITDYAVKWLQGHSRPDPFFLYLAYTAPHFPLHALSEDIEHYRGRFAEGWDAVRERRWARMRKMGLINCGLPPLEADMVPRWNTPDAELVGKIGPGEVTRAVPWSGLTAAQRELQRTKMAIHAAMITRMDRDIGRVLEQLRAMDAWRDTVILFLSDNGASAELLIRADGHDPAAPPGSAGSHLCLGPGWSSASNTPFRLHKSWVHEGGIASPWIVHWPAGLSEAGRLRHNPCHFVDVAPTLLELAGGNPAQQDFAGRSLVPALRKDNTVRHDFIYFHHSNNRALRVGDWKIVAAGQTGPWELYNLSHDRSEMKNLAAQQPERVREMAALWRRQDEAYVEKRESSTPTTKERI